MWENCIYEDIRGKPTLERPKKTKKRQKTPARSKAPDITVDDEMKEEDANGYSSEDKLSSDVYESDSEDE